MCARAAGLGVQNKSTIGAVHGGRVLGDILAKDATALTIGHVDPSEIHTIAFDGPNSNEFDNDSIWFQVRWMIMACSLTAHHTMQVADAKRQICEATGVPVQEQRMFVDSQEFTSDEITFNKTEGELGVLLSRHVSDPLETDVKFFHSFARNPDHLRGGEFTKVRHVANSIYGDVGEYRWHAAEGRSDCRVAIKKILRSCVLTSATERNVERTLHFDHKSAPAEDALTEIGILSYLSECQDVSPRLLRLHGVFSDDAYLWIVTEFAQGGELFSVAAAGVELKETTMKRYTWQLLQAVVYLHEHRIGHRDISLENILLDKPHGEDSSANVKLADFGVAVQSRSKSGTPLRYFRSVGKEFYRPPECYVPSVTANVRVFVPEGSAPGDVVLVEVNQALCEVRLPAKAKVGRLCRAELWGYEAESADVFSCAICLSILGWHSPLWHKAVLTDENFTVFREGGDSGIMALLRARRKQLRSTEMMAFVSEMLRIEPGRRPTAAACLAMPWFASFSELTESLQFAPT
eukprot:TRINITY_DN6403_c0_g2_i1.p1 TRINITY_DN6403_c0_g2~~TRINITY_DN6403_c0_g2_i1.p1  ORF type:complete len:520 (+),score=64.58 TRINITY_DN6403_c0_g2_i1:88-1647(+)